MIELKFNCTLILTTIENNFIGINLTQNIADRAEIVYCSFLAITFKIINYYL